MDGDATLYTAQPYSDADRYRLDPEAGAVVIVRNAGEDLPVGEAEIVEVAATGDTVWRRRLEFGPVRLTRQMLEAELHWFVEGVSAFVEESPAGNGGQSAAGLIEEALYVPDYLPPTKGFFLTSSGHIWLQSHEQQDTLSVWYSLERGHSESPPRRVLLPDWFQALDATDTHVWGVWKDELDINYVVGRRLVPPA